MLSIFSFGLYSILATSPILAAPRLYFDPTSITVTKDSEFTVSLKIDTESTASIGSDASITYASDDQELIGVENGGFFPEFSSANNVSGKIETHAYTTSTFQAKSGTGTLAIIKFKAKKDTGSSTLTFNCSGSGNDTNIVSSTGQNVLTCANLNISSITYTTASTPTPSPSPTPNPDNTAPICEDMTINPTSATGTPTAITITCKGKDNNNEILGAEFVFGDGSTTQFVSRNIGASGTISTTHSFTRTGTMNIECRLKDSTTFSNVCRKSVVIRPTPTPTPRPRTTLRPSPSGAVLSLVDEETPSPIPSPSIEPTTVNEEKKAPSIGVLMLWLLAILIGALLLYLVYRRSKYTPPPIQY